MKNIIISAFAAIATVSGINAQEINIAYSGDTTIVTVNNPTKYIILPVEEERQEAKGRQW